MQVETWTIFYCEGIHWTRKGWKHRFLVQNELRGAEVYMSVHLTSTLGVFGFHGYVLVSVSDTSFIWILGFIFKPIKDSFGLLNQIGFLIVFGEALLKTIGLCVSLSSYNSKVLCLLKEDILLRFNIVACSDTPPTTGQIVVLPKVTRGN